MKDDELDDLDELLRDAALSYNTPPEPPREAMWQAISRARSGASVVPIVAPRRLPRWIAAAAGMAAVLVAGILIGRASRGPAGASTTFASTAHTTTAPAGAHRSDSLNATQPEVPNDLAPPTAPSASVPGSDRSSAAARRFATNPATRRAARERLNRANELSSDGAAYRLAVVEHLTRTEVLLTSFRAQERAGDAARVDAQFAALSRELLGTTRLLLATRRGEDPNITRLLQDLEYVLMQLSQYANDGRRVDLDALNQSMDKRNVIPKLRSNIPAGLSASTGT
jgi:hypothetical protein